MGQSTVLRFRDKPKKVVIGNQNYHSVEFIDSDVTIQPLGNFNTNLFVYTPHKVYGFLLKVTGGTNYDDLVNVRWKVRNAFRKRTVNKSSAKALTKSVNLKFQVNKIKIHIFRVIENQRLGIYIIDFSVANNSKKLLKASDISVYLTRSNKKLDLQETVLELSQIKSGKAIMGRIVVRLKIKKGFSFNIEHRGKKEKVIISRRYL